MKNWSVWFGLRAVAAVFLTFAFYGLAIVIAIAAFSIPVLEVVYAHRVHIQLTILCVVAGFAILAAIWPRFDRFEPPGVPLDGRSQPRLFGLIKRVAEEAGQEPPHDVFLVPEVNAFVAERGGWMGLGSRRVMGVGLPLLQALSVSQFRGVVAHEFGHYYGGDTKLGRWVYRTHMAIARTLANLRNNVIQQPFIWYAKLFARITNAISRRQEFAADAFAVKIAGRNDYAQALAKVHGVSLAYTAYWDNEMAPVLESGFRTQIAGGFACFMSQPEIEQKMSEAVASHREKAKTGVYDTHPALGDRLAFLLTLPDSGKPSEALPAISLVDNLDAYEKALLQFQFGPTKTINLKPIDWQDVGHDVYLPIWQKTTRDFAPAFERVTVAGLAALARSPEPIARLVAEKAGRQVSQQELAGAVRTIVGSALAQSFGANGWKVVAMPGADVRLECNNRTFFPFRELTHWLEDAAAADRWPAACRDFGLADVFVLAGV